MTIVLRQLYMVKIHRRPRYANIFLVLVVTSPLILMSGLLSVKGVAFLLQPRML